MIYLLVLIALYVLAYAIYLHKVNGFYVLSYVIFINFVIDLFQDEVPEGLFFGALRHIFNIIIFFLLIKGREITRLDVFIYAYVIYIFVLSALSPEPFQSLNTAIAFGNSILIFIPAYKTINNSEYESIFEIKRLYTVSMGILILFIFYVAIANLFNIGESQYGAIVNFGHLTTNSVYIIPLCMSFIIFATSKYTRTIQNNLIYLVFSLTFVLLIINMRRTAIVIALIASLAFIAYNIKRLNIKNVAILLILISLFTWYLSPLIMDQLQYRERITQTDELVTEGRFFEFFVFLPYVTEEVPGRQLLFGKHPFVNTEYSRLFYKAQNRTIHSDLINLAVSTGFISLLLFLLINFAIFRRVIRTLDGIDRYYFMVLFGILLLFLIPGRLIGPFTTMAYLYFLMGLIYGTSNNGPRPSDNP